MLLEETYNRPEVHEGWESVYRGNPRLDRFNAALLDRLQADLPAPGNARVLDAGCGVGYHTLAFARRGYSCVGIDISSTILERAARNRSALGLDGRVEFECGPLEHLAFADGSFDVVHCRGVLMHIPNWESSLRQLCRVLAPGGRLVVIESNLSSVEALLTRTVRNFRRNKSKVNDSPGGLEFWAEQDGSPFLVRIARVPALARVMAGCGVRVTRRLASEFWDPYRFPSGVARNLAIDFNRFWFSAGLPASLSVGNVLIGTKGA